MLRAVFLALAAETHYDPSLTVPGRESHRLLVLRLLDRFEKEISHLLTSSESPEEQSSSSTDSPVYSSSGTSMRQTVHLFGALWYGALLPDYLHWVRALPRCPPWAE